ncbi:hypothetical protein D3C86_1711170 [compost metagenome]
MDGDEGVLDLGGVERVEADPAALAPLEAVLVGLVEVGIGERLVDALAQGRRELGVDGAGEALAQPQLDDGQAAAELGLREAEHARDAACEVGARLVAELRADLEGVPRLGGLRRQGEARARAKQGEGREREGRLARRVAGDGQGALRRR